MFRTCLCEHKPEADDSIPRGRVGDRDMTNVIVCTAVVLLAVFFSSTIFLVYKMMRADETVKENRLFPLIIFCLFYLVYFGVGSAIIILHREYMMKPPDETFIYSILISVIGMYATVFGYLLFVKRISISIEAVQSKRSAVVLIVLYSVGWAFRFKLMSLGLYQKYGYLENFQKTEIGQFVNIFVQIQIVMLIFAIVLPFLVKGRYAKILILLEMANSFITGSKLPIIMLPAYYMLISSLNRNQGILRLLRKYTRSIVTIMIPLAPILYLSGFITPYAFDRGLMDQSNYLVNILSDFPDFIAYVAHGKSEYSDSKYTAVRFAPIDPISALVKQKMETGVGFNYGREIGKAFIMMIPRALYANKPDDFGEDPEEQDSLRDFNLPDDDVCGTVILSAYATLGMTGVIFLMFALGAFYARCWNMIRKGINSKSELVRFLAITLLACYLVNFLKIEQTFVTATVLNLRNSLFLAVVLTVFWYACKPISCMLKIK
jgi:hypothetical protein